jgi:acetoin utilization protein AcuC
MTDKRHKMDKPFLYTGENLASYHFGSEHPFGPERHNAFLDECRRKGLYEKCIIREPVKGTDSQVLLFHTESYLTKVKTLSEKGSGYLDQGDTPAVRGIYEAALYVCGSVIDAVDSIMQGVCSRAFIPIAGLHHARRNSASGFCVFNDCGIAIEHLKKKYGLMRIAYIDIDAHHGDGVYYEFESDPCVIIADIHEDGRYLYPGTGFADEAGKGESEGLKLNIPMPPGTTDEKFLEVFEKVETFLEKTEPQFFILQCGADSLRGDPITHMQLSEKSHGHAAKSLRKLAEKYAEGRLLACGGGGYNLKNIASAWNSVLQEML